MDQEAGSKPSEVTPFERTTGSFKRPTTYKVKEEQEEALALCWEAQWQEFLRTVDSPPSPQGVLPLAEAPSAPWDDARGFLASFEQVAEACQWPKDEWAARLLPALGGEAKQVFGKLEARDKQDYGKVKEAILQEDAMRRDRMRQCFRRFCYQETEGPRGTYRRLQRFCHEWLRVEKHSKEQILELLILEQFLSILPPEIHCWVTEHGPNTCSQAVALAENFLQRQRDTQMQEDQAVLEEEAATFSKASQTLEHQLTTETKQEDDGASDMLATQKTTEEIVNQDGPGGSTAERPHGISVCKVERDVSHCGWQEDALMSQETPHCQQDTLPEQVEKSIPCWGCDPSSPEIIVQTGIVPAGGGWKNKESKGELLGRSSERVGHITSKENFGNQGRSKMQEANHTEKRRDPSSPRQGEDFCQILPNTRIEKERSEYSSVHSRVDVGETWAQSFNFGDGFNKSSNLLECQAEVDQYQCPDCGKSFNRKTSLTVHRRIHTGEKLYQCPQCEKSFNQVNDFIFHQRSHTRGKPYICVECGKAFSKKGKLTSHQRIHTGEKPYTCSECGKGFSVKCNLTSHLRIHTGEKLFTCSHCNKSFCNHSTLIKHRRIHTGEKPYECFFCGKCFVQSSSLISHMRNHKGKKPYNCTECRKSFSKKKDLTMHQRDHAEMK